MRSHKMHFLFVIRKERCGRGCVKCIHERGVAVYSFSNDIVMKYVGFRLLEWDNVGLYTPHILMLTYLLGKVFLLHGKQMDNDVDYLSLEILK